MDIWNSKSLMDAIYTIRVLMDVLHMLFMEDLPIVIVKCVYGGYMCIYIIIYIYICAHTTPVVTILSPLCDAFIYTVVILNTTCQKLILVRFCQIASVDRFAW